MNGGGGEDGEVCFEVAWGFGWSRPTGWNSGEGKKKVAGGYDVAAQKNNPPRKEVGCVWSMVRNPVVREFLWKGSVAVVGLDCVDGSVESIGGFTEVCSGIVIEHGGIFAFEEFIDAVFQIAHPLFGE